MTPAAERMSRRQWLAAGAALGLLLPLLPMFHGGEFAFYILWQAGYAVALLTRSPR